MKRFYMLILSVIVLPFCGFSQSTPWWEHTNVPVGSPYLYLEYTSNSYYDFMGATDTVSGNTYVVGFKTPLILPNNIFVFNGNSWSHLANLDASIYAMAFYHGELYIGSGSLSMVDSTGASYTAGFLSRYDGETLETLEVSGGVVTALTVLEDTLYVGGSFTHVDSVSSPHVAKYDGENWYPIPDNPYVDMPNYQSVYSFAKYQNELYIGGLSPDVNDQDLLVYHDGEWQGVGEGIAGLYTRINYLEVFQGELYAAGIIRQDEGNPGNGIQKWNGETWSQAGLGISSDEVVCMKKFQDGLFISGEIDSAGYVPVNGVARWDGTQWCGMQTFLEGQIVHGMFTHDESIYMPLMNYSSDPFFDYEGDVEVYKWVGGDDFGPCSEITGLEEPTSVNKTFEMYPNPSSSSVIFRNTTTRDGELNIIDITGKQIRSGIPIQTKGRVNLDLSNNPSGIYFVQLLLENGELQTAKLVVE